MTTQRNRTAKPFDERVVWERKRKKERMEKCFNINSLPNLAMQNTRREKQKQTSNNNENTDVVNK